MQYLERMYLRRSQGFFRIMWVRLPVRICALDEPAWKKPDTLFNILQAQGIRGEDWSSAGGMCSGVQFRLSPAQASLLVQNSKQSPRVEITEEMTGGDY